MSYIYLKQPLKKYKQSSVIRPKLPPKLKKIIASGLFVSGLLLFISAALPLVRFQIEYSSKFGQVVNPLSAKFYNQTGRILGDLSTDYTQLSNWFVSSPQTNDSPQKTDGLITYYITVPSAKIIDATVTMGNMDLKKSLIQYPQTALPGQLGNTVIFGHSVLPQFFNPKSYLTIFSTLYKLDKGDEVIIRYDNITYKYLIEDMFEVQPTDLSVLEQRFDGRYLTLITCSPPGTYLRRLIIKARIADF